MGCLFDLITGLIVRVLFGRMLRIRPRIIGKNGRLTASTMPHLALFTLFLKLRSVTIDTKLRMIQIHTRLFWVVSFRRFVHFDAVECVRYTWVDLNPIQYLASAGYQELDLYTISVVTSRGAELTLCRFLGPGDAVNETMPPDWWFWENIAFTALSRGDQETESSAYAATVAAVIGVPLTNE